MYNLPNDLKAKKKISNFCNMSNNHDAKKRISNFTNNFMVKKALNLRNFFNKFEAMSVKLVDLSSLKMTKIDFT